MSCHYNRHFAGFCEGPQDAGDGFILVAVDLPGEEGGRALRGPYSPKLDGRSGVQADDSPPLRLAKLTEDQAPLPADEVMAVKTQSGATMGRGWRGVTIPRRIR